MFAIHFRRYRDKERSSPTGSSHASSGVTTTEPKKTISTSSTKVPPKTISKTPAPPSNKKIDMGAASTFGQSDDLGINSPTHRNTHDEEDLFDNNNYMPISSSSAKPVFKTCPPPSPPLSRNENHDDFEFNPREDENDFGDFTSAFGDNPAPTATTNVVLPSAAPTVDIFAADFGGAFSATPNTNNTLLFDAPLATSNPPPPVANNEMSLFGSPLGAATMSTIFASSQPTMATGGHDFLSDFGGLNMNSPVLTGKCNEMRVVFLVFVFFLCYRTECERSDLVIRLCRHTTTAIR